MAAKIVDLPGLTVAQRNVARISPESLIGGFSRRDSTFLFYSLINSVVEKHFHILDFGAGRGAQFEQCAPYKGSLLNFKGRVERVVGVDVDDAVMENPLLDEAHLFTPGQPLPFPDASFDLIFSDWVLEHVDDPKLFVAEIDRLLKPGGWFFARTPNKYGAIALASSMIPNKSHTKVLSKLQPGRQHQDVFPTRYRMNTLSQIRALFDGRNYQNYSTTVDTEIGYVLQSRTLFGISEFVARFLPKSLRPVLFVSLRKG